MRGVCFLHTHPLICCCFAGIVITDLGSFSDDDASEDAPGPHISPALLERLRQPLAPLVPAPPQTQALVLFRPLSSQVSPQKQNQNTVTDTARDDDAMEVEL